MRSIIRCNNWVCAVRDAACATHSLYELTHLEDACAISVALHAVPAKAALARGVGLTQVRCMQKQGCK